MASLGLPGLAGFWGEFPAILSAYSPAAGLNEELFRGYMVVAAIGTVLAAGYLLWMFQRTAFGTPKEEFADAHIHDMHGPEWLAWTPMLAADRRCSASTRPRSSASPTRRCGAATAALRGLAVRCPRRARRTSTTTRSRRRSSSPASLVVVLLARPGRRRAAQVRPPRASPASACWPRWSRSLTLAVDGADRGRCSAAPTSSTTSPWC